MIGTRLCEHLLAQGYSITGTDIRPNPWHRRIDDLTVIADLRRPSDLEKLPTDIDMVVHLAANARVYDLVLHPHLARDNFDMLFNTLEFCRQHTVSGFLFASSREVYGNSDRHMNTEDEAMVWNCESPYAASKYGGEALVNAYHHCYGINFIIFRLSNVFGMYDTSDRVIPLFIRQTLQNQDIIVYGRGKCLDLSYIDDTVAGILSCIRKFPGVKNRTFNIASGRSIPILDVARLIRDAMNGENAIITRENRKGEVMRSAVSISRAEKELCYAPRVSIEEGILRTIAWYRDRGLI